MNVLIKGMEMPENCCECPINLYLCKHGFKYLLQHRELYDKRADDCPLVPVPPHGDLVDIDAYRDEFMNGVYALCRDDSDNYRANAIIDLFDAAPIIIDAEEEERQEPT